LKEQTEKAMKIDFKELTQYHEKVINAF